MGRATEKQKLSSIESHRLRKYGVTREQFEALKEEQNGRCATCKREPEGKGKRAGELCVDHDHETGKVRGLLCHKCNAALGQVGDSPRILAAMIVYLEDHGINWYTVAKKKE